ncbi:GntR family transcriptional regulator [Mycobacterium tuberculosis]|nr:GntR family transcriptional regulator [Mycobacterium tuberculosis]
MLDLFLLILVELFRRHLSSTEQALPTWSDWSLWDMPTYGFSKRSALVTTAWPVAAPAAIWTLPLPGGSKHQSTDECVRARPHRARRRRDCPIG